MTSSDTENRLRALRSHPFAAGIGIALLAVLLVSISFALQAHIFLNLSDEGFLWYGTWRASLGEVPIRDFQSYEPGRYYWGAFWFQFLGDGIIALRTSNAIFQCIGLTFGLLVLRRLSQRLDFLFVSGLMLLVWMYPRHKLFDVSIALAAVYVTLCLLEKPNLKRHFAAGIFVGIAAFFGRNHGLYGCVALGLAILFSWRQHDGPHWLHRGLSWSAGILVGSFPLLLMALFVPGYFDSVIERISTMMEVGATNVSQPIPWPWTIWTSPPAYLEPLGLGSLTGFIVGWFYLIWFVFLGAVGLQMLRNREPLTKERAVLFAAALVSLPYLHHASARAGITHLAQAIHPLLIGLLASAYLLARTRHRYLVPATLLGLVVMSAGSIVMLSPLFLRLTAQDKFLIWGHVREDTILLRVDVVRAISKAERISRWFMNSDDSVFIAPRLPAYYPIMLRSAPVKEIYLTRKGSQEMQEAMREELESKNVRWAIIDDGMLDNREELRFRNTHPDVWRYIEENFKPVTVRGLRENQTLFKRRGRKPKPTAG